MAPPKTPPQSTPLQPLTPAVFHVLLALAHGTSHGYAISKDVMARTGGAVKLGPGTLYPTLSRLLELGWVAEAAGHGVDSRRRLYALTPLGRRVAIAEAERVAQLVVDARDRSLLPRRS